MYTVVRVVTCYSSCYSTMVPKIFELEALIYPKGRYMHICIMYTSTNYIHFQFAALFVESLPSVAGQIIPPSGYFQKVAE